MEELASMTWISPPKKPCLLPKGLSMSQTYHALARCILGAILLFSAVGCDDDDDAEFVDFSVSCSTVNCFNVDEIGSFFDDDGTQGFDVRRI